jgi:hypothetical protein
MRYTKHISESSSIKLAFFLVFFVLPTAVFSQIDLFATETSRKTTDYIEKLDTVISIRLNFNNEFEYFKQEGDNFFYDIRPNISLSNKLSVSYRGLTGNIGFTPKFYPGNSDNEKAGKTESFSLGFTLNTNHIIQNFYGQSVKGFYLHNTADFVPDWDQETDPYLTLPDLRVFKIEGSTSFKFNANYSTSAISSQTEIQTKSCGSFIPTLSYAFFQVDNSSASSTQTSSQLSKHFQSIVSVSYLYTFVIHSKFYAAAGLSPGFGYDWTWLTTHLPDGDVKTNYTDEIFQIKERICLGYNTRKLYAGSEISLAQSKQNQNNTSVNQEANRVYLQFFIGYRFTAPRFIKRGSDAVLKKAPAVIRNSIE